MANIVDPELKIQAEEYANSKTQWERGRLDYYLGLRYNYSINKLDNWLDAMYEADKVVFVPQKNPTHRQIRNEAGIGLGEYIKSRFIPYDKIVVNKKILVTGTRLISEVTSSNEHERNRCNEINQGLTETIRKKSELFLAHNPYLVKDYFSFVLSNDSFALDGNPYPIDFHISYLQENKRLIIDYRFPLKSQISGIKEWKVDKNFDVIPKEMKKSDYTEMYERILFDLAIRTVGIIFDSDDRNVVDEIVFNGSCVYSNYQNYPTVLLSFLMPKKSFKYNNVRKQDFVSKFEISKLEEVRYLSDITSQHPPVELLEEPPTKLVVPIQSS